jgi:hypothetical protein
MFTKNTQFLTKNNLKNNKFVTLFGLLFSILLLDSVSIFANQGSQDLKSDTCSRLGGFARMVMQTHQTGGSLGEFRTSLQAMQVAKGAEEAIWVSRTKSLGNSVIDAAPNYYRKWKDRERNPEITVAFGLFIHKNCLERFVE